MEMKWSPVEPLVAHAEVRGGRLKQTSRVSRYYLFAVQALFITGLPLCTVALLVRQQPHLPASPLHPTFTVQ